MTVLWTTSLATTFLHKQANGSIQHTIDCYMVRPQAAELPRWGSFRLKKTDPPVQTPPTSGRGAQPHRVSDNFLRTLEISANTRRIIGLGSFENGIGSTSEQGEFRAPSTSQLLPEVNGKNVPILCTHLHLLLSQSPSSMFQTRWSDQISSACYV